ncbi:MAG: hypothetical protein ACOWWM_06760, partial [Desulfobacterales bacterium]
DNNTSIDDLIADINSILGPLASDIWALEDEGSIVFESGSTFFIEYSSIHESLLGLTDMPAEEIEANRSSNSGVLSDDVTLVVWVNLGTRKIVGEVTVSAADTADNDSKGAIMDLVLNIQEALNTASYVNLDGEAYTDDFSNDPVTVGGVADPIVKVKLKNGKILFASQYQFKILPQFADPAGGPDLVSSNAGLLGLDTVADGIDVDSSRPFNIIAAAAGSEVIFGSPENPLGELYMAGSVLSDHQITLVEGPDTNLDLDWSALMQTIDGPIILDLGENGFLKGDLIAGGSEGDVILTAEDTLNLNGKILADRDVLIEAGFEAAGPADDSVTVSPTAWIRTNALSPDENSVQIDGFNHVTINGPIGSLQTDEARMGGDVFVTSENGNIVVTEESGWIETGGRILLTGDGIDIAGVIKNAGATAPEPAGDPTAENYEVVIDASGTVTLAGDVDALGSVLITTPNPFVLQGSIEAGGVETFEFITEARAFIDGVDERVRIESPSIVVGGGTGVEGPDGSDEDLHPGLIEGGTYPLGARIVASGLIELMAPDGIDIRTASELIVRHDDSLIHLEADYVDIVGALYAGADPGRVSLGDLPAMVWVGSAAGVTILASEMVTLGGEDLATDLDVLNGDADAAGETITRGGSIEATGLVQITVSGGADPFFHLNEESFIKTDALAVEEPSEGAASAVQIQSDDGIQILGVIQALDPDSDVTLVSGTGLLEIQGFVEAGDQLTLTGATAASGSDIGVLVGKLLYETRTELALTTDDEERPFTVDRNGDLIDDYGFLLALDETDKVIVDEYGVAQRKIGDDGYPELGAGAVYITYDESDNPVTVDKEGYLLAEYEVSPGEMRYFRVDGDDRFLDDQGFVIDERGIRLDADGEWINQFGYLIDEFGNYINEFGNAIDAYGYRVDSYGNLIDIDSHLISADGYRINEQGLLINGVGDPLNGVGAIRTVVDLNGDIYRADGLGNLVDDEGTIVSVGDLDTPSLADQYGNLVSDQNELIREIAGTYYLINERGELIDLDGVPITALDYPVEAQGAPVVVSDAGTIEAPVAGAERLSEGSIQPGAGPMPTTGPVMVDLPERRSGGVLNTTGDAGAITITTDKVVELHGMVG